jgi:hypothetical protein
MANKNKKKAQPQQQMSPYKYVTSGRARQLPIYECWIAPDWKEAGISVITVARKHSTGNVTMGSYLMDVLCLGLKDTTVIFSKPEDEYREIIDGMFENHGDKVLIDYALAHNIIYGGIAYAEDLGFKPEKEWSLSQFMLEEDTEDIELIDIEFGRDGKPCYINGPYDNVGKVISKLEASVGKGNFIFTALMGDGFKAKDFFGNRDFSADDEFEDGEFEGTIEDVEHEEIKK